jgi:hypothetical protein
MLCLIFAKVYNCSSCFYNFSWYLTKEIVVKLSTGTYPAGYPANTVSGASLEKSKFAFHFSCTGMIRDEKMIWSWYGMRKGRIRIRENTFRIRNTAWGFTIYKVLLSTSYLPWLWIRIRIRIGSGFVSESDPDSVSLWIRIRIGNPDPGSGSRGKKMKKFQ